MGAVGDGISGLGGDSVDVGVGGIAVLVSVGVKVGCAVGRKTMMSGEATGMQAARPKVRKIIAGVISLTTIPPVHMCKCHWRRLSHW